MTGFGELASRSFGFAGAPIYSETVAARDKGGRIRDLTERTSHGAQTTVSSLHYDYDRAGRLVGVSRDGTEVAAYEYDDNGNRLKRTFGGVVVKGVYDAQDRLTQYCPQDAGQPAPQLGSPCFQYTYAASGELASKDDLVTGQTTAFDYDEMGGLRTVTLPSSTVIEYEIDAVGRRVGKKINGVKQWGMLYQDGQRPIAQLDASNNVAATFVYATRGNVPDYMVKGGQTYRFVVDHLGSVRAVVNVANGSVVQSISYDEWGEATLVSGTWDVQPFGFAGGLYDADTGLVRFGARDYDAVVGRWTAKDPILFEGGDTNLYVHVANDPVNWIDPSGLFIETAWDVFNLGLGIASLASNLDCGNYGDAALDALGIGADGLAAVVPFVPGGAGAAVKASRLSAIKKALKQVHKEVGGSLPKGARGKFGSPQRGDPRKGYRLDPGHPGRPPGDPEAGPHINWWDYSGGKRGSGGRSGAVPIED